VSKFQIYSLLRLLINIYEWILIIRIITSYLDIDPYHPLVQFLRRLTDPVMDLVRRYIPCQFGRMDFSPMVIIFFLYVVQRALATLLLSV
jgi:YggT family protein